MIDYIIYFSITLIVSTFFAMGGVGSAVALVPIFDTLGMGFNLAKATALFINTSTTVTATFMNLKRKTLDIKFALPLTISSLIMAPFGAKTSQFINVEYAKMGLALFLIFSASMMLFGKKEAKTHFDSKWIHYVVGGVVGFISGILGVGGGSLIMPLMILLGYDAKKMAVAVSFMIPFSTFSAFLAYSSFVQIDFVLLGVVTIAAVFGGYIGNKIMHFRLDAKQIKKLIAILLYIIAIKIIYTLS
jgi:uncharacterized membrane protein YfcA